MAGEVLKKNGNVWVDERLESVEPEQIGRHRKAMRRVGRVLTSLGCAVLGAAIVVSVWWFGFEEAKWDETEYDDKSVAAMRAGEMDERYGAWVEVDGKDVSYPIVQGEDNEYYLYHDLDGNDSYTTVFMDYRSDWLGQNKIVYGHTLVAGGMFRPLADTYEQDSFNEVKAVHYTPAGASDAATKTYVPVCALSVDPTYEKIQQFDFTPDQRDFEARCEAWAVENANAGNWNDTTQDREWIEEMKLVAFTGEGQERGEDGALVDVYRVFVCNEDEQAKVLEQMRTEALRDWVREICQDATAVSPNAAELIEQADTTLTLACCSWPFNQTRTLLVCVEVPQMETEPMVS